MIERRRCGWLAGALLTAAALAFSALPMKTAPAAALPEANVAVVDYQRLLKQSAAGRHVHRQIDNYRKSFQAEVKREEEALRDVEEKLKRERDTLSASEFQKRKRNFEERVIALQRRAQDSMRALDRSFQESMSKLHNRVLPLVEDISGKQGYNVVIDRSKVVIVLKTRDLTDEVIAVLNKKIPKLKVPKPTTK